MNNPTLHLILGGARSGKSQHAEQAAQRLFEQSNDHRQLIYLATATAEDNEMQRRIEHHKMRRAAHWQLIEESLNISDVLVNSSAGTTILIDCLTLWLSNCLHSECWKEQREKLLNALQNCQANVVMVSNEVGNGIVPMGELSRKFIDESGWLHQELAKQCAQVTLVVAGLPMDLKVPPNL